MCSNLAVVNLGLLVEGWDGAAATVNRCCQSDHREEAETNAPRYSADCHPAARQPAETSSASDCAAGDLPFLTGFTHSHNLHSLLLSFGRKMSRGSRGLHQLRGDNGIKYDAQVFTKATAAADGD